MDDAMKFVARGPVKEDKAARRIGRNSLKALRAFDNQPPRVAVPFT